MGGRGIKLSATRTMRDVVGQRAGGGGGEANPQGQAGGGGGAAEFTTSSGARVAAGGATDTQIRALLGNNFNRETVANIVGGRNGSMELRIENGRVYGFYNGPTYRSQFALERASDGSVRFVGSSLFSNDTSARGQQAVSGAAIRTLQGNLSRAVNSGLVQRLIIPIALGDAGSRSEIGSSLWARLGANASLSSREIDRLRADTSLPSSIRNATTISGLMQDKAGQRWWEANRRSFRGEIDFRVREGDSFNIWSRFLRA